MAERIVKVPKAIHFYKCEKGHEQSSPHELTACQAGRCHSPLHTYGKQGKESTSSPASAAPR